jgi:undecaprenyl pyrophosphate phosphatase UppP
VDAPQRIVLGFVRGSTEFLPGSARSRRAFAVDGAAALLLSATKTIS